MFVELLEFDIQHDGPGGPEVRVQVQGKHLQRNGVVHGSVIHALLDTVMGIESYRACGRRPVATAELNVRFLEPVFDGTLTARARVLKAGKRLIVVDGEVRQGERLVAVGQGTFAVIRGP